MRKNRHDGFILMEKGDVKLKLFETGLVIAFEGNKIKDENFPCLMSAMRNFEKQGYRVIETKSDKTAPMGEASFVEVYSYSKEFQDRLELTEFKQVGPWENRWAWKYIAVKSRMFSLGLNPIDAVKGLETEFTKSTKFNIGETISLGDDNLCRSIDTCEDNLVHIHDDILVSDITDTDYVFSLGSDSELFEKSDDPDSPNIQIIEVSKSIINVDASAAYISGNVSTLPFKEI